MLETSSFFGLRLGGPSSVFSINGTLHLPVLSSTPPVVFWHVDGGLFTQLSIDIAEYSIFAEAGALTVPVIREIVQQSCGGYRLIVDHLTRGATCGVERWSGNASDNYVLASSMARVSRPRRRNCSSFAIQSWWWTKTSPPPGSTRAKAL